MDPPPENSSPSTKRLRNRRSLKVSEDSHIMIPPPFRAFIDSSISSADVAFLIAVVGLCLLLHSLLTFAEDASGTSKTQPYNCFTSNDGYKLLTEVSTAGTWRRESAIRRHLSSVRDAKISKLHNAGLTEEIREEESIISSTTTTLMDSNNSISTEVLSREESLQLFRCHVGHAMDYQDIETYGRAIVDKCFGLPLIIKVVGRALRMDNNIHSWICALKDITCANTLHQVIKIGYDRLAEHDIKSCFLYSALFTASKAIRISALVDFIVDEGFVAGSMPDARRRGHKIIRHLIDVCLLECTDDGLMVKMHGLICDLALEILSDVQGLQMLLSRYSRLKENRLVQFGNSTSDRPDCSERTKSLFSAGQLCIVKAGEGLIEPPSEKEWEEAKMVFLMDNKLSNLPKRPTSSKLLILFLQRNTSLRAIPSSFFENMSSLKILNLSKTRIKSLPQSLPKLGCLQVLILRNCERLLYLPSDIGALKHLFVLDVHGTELCQLPDEIGELLCLVHLQVRFYGSMDEDELTMLPSQLISKGVISRLSRLLELSIIVYPGDPRWIDIASDITTEVSKLDLHSLAFHFPEINHLEHFINVSLAWRFLFLTRFNFIVGHDVKRLVSHVSDELEYEYSQQDRCFRFVNDEDIPDAIPEVLSQTTAFYLDHHLTAYSLTQFGRSNLKFCIVRDCPKLNAIFNYQQMTEECFPFLEFLSIHYSRNLSQIWVGPIPAGSVLRLKRLSVHSCPKLEFIFSRSMVAILYNLEELIVEDCQSLKNVIGNEEQICIADVTRASYLIEANYTDSNSIGDDVVVDLSVVTELRLKVLKLHYLPKLTNIWYNGSGDLPCLEHLSVYNCPRLKSLNLKSQLEVTIKKIKVEPAWWHDLEWDDPAVPEKLQHCVEEINGDDIWGSM